MFLPHFRVCVLFLRAKNWTFDDAWPSGSNSRQRDFKAGLSFCFFPLVITKPIWTRNSNHVCDRGEKEGDTEMGETPRQEYLLLRWPRHDGPAKGHLLLDPLPHPGDMYTLLHLRVSFHWAELPDNGCSGSRGRTFFLGSLWMVLGWLSLSSWAVSIDHAKWIHCCMLIAEYVLPKKTKTFDQFYSIDLGLSQAHLGNKRVCLCFSTPLFSGLLRCLVTDCLRSPEAPFVVISPPTILTYSVILGPVSLGLSSQLTIKLKSHLSWECADWFQPQLCHKLAVCVVHMCLLSELLFLSLKLTQHKQHYFVCSWNQPWSYLYVCVSMRVCDIM